MGVASRSSFAALVEALLGVLTDRLQELIARLGPARVGDDERLRHESGQQFEHVCRVDAVAGHDCFRGREREAAGENAQAVEHATFHVVEQVVGPVDRGAQRLMALDRAAVAAGEHAEPMVEALGQLDRGQ